MNAVIGKPAPNFDVSEWVQGDPTNIDQEQGHVVLVEVFQVNCPGCFLHALPEAISIYKHYKGQGIRVIGIATAFEDFDKNTVENLRLLAETGEVIGETKNVLSAYGQLEEGNRLPYSIPFPLAMDQLTKTPGEVSQGKIMQLIYSKLPHFDSYPENDKHTIRQRVKRYLESKSYSAETFEKYGLQGTPSTILVDRTGILRDVSFGQVGHMKTRVHQLLNE